MAIITEKNFLDSIATLPTATITADTRYWWEEWEKIDHPNNALLSHPHARPLMDHIFCHSPYLARLLINQSEWFISFCAAPLSATMEYFYHALNNEISALSDSASLMKTLRIAKQRIALLVATADIANIWQVKEITYALSDFALFSVRAALKFLLLDYHHKEEIHLQNTQDVEEHCGIFILAMGKLGAYELNYSSDIDLIILFDPEHFNYTGRYNQQKCSNKIAQDLMGMLQDRTADGYVFRTDLRLRPDPSSTPLAVSTSAALHYYETVGQNWERAAMIKATYIAGDSEAASEYLMTLKPFIWQQHLDFAAIEDIQSIKRQMHSAKEIAENLYEHNIKLGVGGIREIEFLAQIQQLIWGGRHRELRTKPTIETLSKLVDLKIITPEQKDTLQACYWFLRKTEHHLQMINDQQTHTLPPDETMMHTLASFMGHNHEDFIKKLHETLTCVHHIYDTVLPTSTPLSADGNLVFTGVDHDPDTLKTLEKLGYKKTELVSSTIMGWHRGNRRATRSKRGRQLLTELIPLILTELGNTTNPDAAFIRFDDFLTKLPVGIQLFSLIHAKPYLMELIATIMGSAPALADTLGKFPYLLEAVLQSEFFTALPTQEALYHELKERIHHARDTEDALDLLRIYKGEKQFQAGIHMLRQSLLPVECNIFLTQLADIVLQETIQRITDDFIATNGRIAGGCLAVIAMGRQGAGELTFGSDLDLVFLYDAPDILALSDGDRQIDARLYYQRLCKRIITALSSLMRYGTLYEVDARLRPSGNDSPLAIHMDMFKRYIEESAWTFERMALTRARIVTSQSDSFSEKVTTLISRAITQHNTHASLAGDVLDMHTRIHNEFPSTDPWNIKHSYGGLMDIDFIAQYIILKHSHTFADLLHTEITLVFKAARMHGIIPDSMADELIKARYFQISLLSFLRLCSNKQMNLHDTPIGLQKLLCKAMKEDSLEAIEKQLCMHQNKAIEHFNNLALY